MRHAPVPVPHTYYTQTQLKDCWFTEVLYAEGWNALDTDLSPIRVYLRIFGQLASFPTYSAIRHDPGLRFRRRDPQSCVCNPEAADKTRGHRAGRRQWATEALTRGRP